jgi:2-methylisocitrate lyase-like PEP mutase family enzyme
MSKSRLLKELLAAGETLVMPDAYDPVSARIIEQLGFKAVQCSGFSMALAQLCPSEAEFGRDRNVAITRAICQAVQVPVMADAEDGFAGPEGIGDTIREYVQAGVAGLNIEDQVLGAPTKRLVAREEAVAKIAGARAAAEAGGDPELVINARTDALSVAEADGGGLAEAISRGNLYLEAGADLIFLTGVTTLDEVRAAVREIGGPVSIAAGMPNNMDAFSIKDLREDGVARVSLPSLAIFGALRAVCDIMQSVRDTDGFAEIVNRGLTWSMGDVARLGDLRR